MLHRGNKESKYKGLSPLGGWVEENDILYYLRQKTKHLCRGVLLSQFLFCALFNTYGVGYCDLNLCICVMCILNLNMELTNRCLQK